MEIIRALKQEYSHIDPIIILAPTQRCGSTLVQRLINAGGEAIIYGENFFLSESLPLHLGGIAHNFREKCHITGETHRSFTSGERGMDATTLFPDYNLYCEKALRLFYELLEFYSQESSKNGFNHWGIKYQIRDMKGAGNFINLLPHSRIICVLRDLVDVARSFYARWPESLKNPKDFTRLGQRWARHIGFMQRIKSPNKLEIRYEEFMSNKEIIVQKIERAVSVPINVEELSRRINIHDSDPRHAVDTNKTENGYYIPPAELPQGAIKALMLGAREMYQKQGYYSEK